MSEKDNFMKKTIEHNNNVRGPKGMEEKRKSLKEMKETRSLNNYRKRKADLKNIMSSNSGVILTLDKAIRNDEEDKVDTFDKIVERNKEILDQVFERIVKRRKNHEQIIGLFPDTKLAIEILVSYILSPSKMTDSKVLYKLDKAFLNGAESMRSTLIRKINEYIEEEYKFSDKLPDMFTKILTYDGAAPRLILSEAVVDDIINADIVENLSQESFEHMVELELDRYVRPLGVIDNKHVKKIDLKDVKNHKDLANYMASSSVVKYSDNMGILTIPGVKSKLRSSYVRNSIRKGVAISNESTDKVNYLDAFRDRRTRTDFKPTIIIEPRDESTRKSIGKPMDKPIPVEAVIPLPSLGDPTDHLGYFILIDPETGNPISAETNPSLMDELNNSLNGGTFTNNPITDVYRQLVSDKEGTCVDVQGLFEMYKNILEKQIYETFKASLYGEDVHVPNVNDIYYLMFCRALQAQQTTVLFVPKENLVYFSLFRNCFGIGKTILEDLEVLYSIRSILALTRVMAHTRNAIPTTILNCMLNPNDPDPEGTIKAIQQRMLKIRKNDLPLGENDATRLVDWIQKLGLGFNFKGHPDIPEMDIDFQQGSLTHELPDSDYEEELKKQSITGIGLPPEVIDQAYSPDFAAGILSNSALLAKRANNYQKNINPELSKYVSTIVYNDYNLRSELKEIIRKESNSIKESLTESEKSLMNKDEDRFFEYYVDKISENIICELPKASETNIEILSEEFNNMKEKIENALEVILNDDMLSSENTGIVGEKMDFLKGCLVSMYMRKWAADNNYLPDVFGFIGTDEEKVTSTIEGVGLHYNSVVKNLIGILDKFSITTKASEDSLKEIERQTKDNEEDGYGASY